MEIKGNSLVKSFSVYTISGILSAGIPFLILPILTHHISTEDYGLLANYKVIFSLVMPLMGLSVAGALSRMYYERDKIDFPVYLSNGLILLLINSLVIGAILFGFRATIFELTQISSKWLLAALIISLGYNISLMILTIWRLQNRSFSFGVLNVFRSLLNFGFSLFFVITLLHSWKGRIEGELIAVLFFAVLSVWFLYKGKWLKFKLSKKYIKDILQFGLPLIPHSLGAVIIAFSDRILITKYVGLSSTGLYAVGSQVAAILLILFSSFILAWIPWLYEKLKKNNSEDKKKIVKITYSYFAILFLLAVLLQLFAPVLFRIFIGEEFQTAQTFISWLVFGLAFNGMYRIVVPYLFYLKKTYIVGIVSISVAILNIGLNILLINRSGAIGAAQATCVSFLLQFLIIWFISGKHFKMPWFSAFKK